MWSLLKDFCDSPDSGKMAAHSIDHHAVVAGGLFDFHRQFRNRPGTLPVFVIHVRTATNQRPGQKKKIGQC
jgi:hypothetical protein